MPTNETVVSLPKVSDWSVETTRGVTVTVKATAPIVSEHGHLEFSNGDVFARNEWSFAIRNDQEASDK